MMLDTDFKIVGSCVARPQGTRRVLLDAICRLTGHLLWRNQHTEYLPPNGSLSVSTSHCRRCHRWGYVEADYRPRPASQDVRVRFVGDTFVADTTPFRRVIDKALDDLRRRDH
jgi:hypothetical protein